MNSQYLKLNLNDIAKGLIMAVLAAVFTYLLGLINTPGFDLSSLDWQEVLRIAVSSGMAYMVKNLFTDEQGRFAGKI